jgi:hypothetical protein
MVKTNKSSKRKARQGASPSGNAERSPSAEPVPWQHSKAKEILVGKLESGEIPLTTEEMGPRKVYDLEIDGGLLFRFHRRCGGLLGVLGEL